MTELVYEQFAYRRRTLLRVQYPTDQPVQNIMSYRECVAGICAAYVFLLMKGALEEIGDAGGLETFSMKEGSVEKKIFWQIWN